MNLQRSLVILLVLVNAGTVLAHANNSNPFSPHSAKAVAVKNEIDKTLRITAPLLGKKVIGNALIRGNAKPGSSIKITISSTYYKLGTDQQKRKLFKGEGPLKGAQRVITIRANGQGFWSTDAFNFRNHGWSEEFKIVATSVEGKNSTYVIVTNDVKPIVEWD